MYTVQGRRRVRADYDAPPAKRRTVARIGQPATGPPTEHQIAGEKRPAPWTPYVGSAPGVLRRQYDPGAPVWVCNPVGCHWATVHNPSHVPNPFFDPDEARAQHGAQPLPLQLLPTAVQDMVLAYLDSVDLLSLRATRSWESVSESLARTGVAARRCIQRHIDDVPESSYLGSLLRSRFMRNDGRGPDLLTLPPQEVEPWLYAGPSPCTRAYGLWLRALRDMETNECPLQFFAPSEAHTSHDPAHQTSTVSLLPGATIPPIFAAVCQHNVMRTGVHAVMITVNDHGAIVAGGAAFWRLGIVSREYARAAPFSVASASEHGWGLAPCGAVFHGGSALATVFGTKEWSVGDQVRLQLDVEAGLLWGFTNNEPVRLLANVRQPGTWHSGWLWCVDMCKAAGASITIRRVAIQQIEGAAAIVERQQHPFGVIGGESFSF